MRISLCQCCGRFTDGGVWCECCVGTQTRAVRKKERCVVVSSRIMRFKQSDFVTVVNSVLAGKSEYVRIKRSR